MPTATVSSRKRETDLTIHHKDDNHAAILHSALVFPDYADGIIASVGNDGGKQDL